MLDRPLKTPEHRSMTTEETLSFLREHGVEPIAIKDLLPHEPFLYVLQESLRDDGGRYYDVPRIHRPNIIRVDAPVSIGLETGQLAEGVMVYDVTATGQLDYYVIDQATKKPRIVKITKLRDRKRFYFISEGNVFRIKDDIFPKSKPSHIVVYPS